MIHGKTTRIASRGYIMGKEPRWVLTDEYMPGGETYSRDKKVHSDGLCIPAVKKRDRETKPLTRGV